MRRSLLLLMSLVTFAAMTTPAFGQSQMYGFYLDELSRNGDAPAVSRSVWAGRVAPAAWRSIDRTGWYLDWGQDNRTGFSEDLFLLRVRLSGRASTGIAVVAP